ncbi:hypothetical protein COLO4_14855 [Corchorus olitorius]|uniref:Uncharacterized protein n=1 Tax=Corchorus olitorius TaxID=93759 RepID=A0A1R3JQW6_9ROSI|nr:hypothetical protein COLO4_14855 [Corchorus olitorius]
MDILGLMGSRADDDLSDIKKAILNACLEDSDDSDCDDTSDLDDFPDQVQEIKEDDGFEYAYALRRMFGEDTLQSPPLVSALKGSREKHGLKPKVELTVKWAPDVYDPIPTTVTHTRGRKLPKSRKTNDKFDKKKNGKKQKGNNSRGGKDTKQSRRGGGGNSAGSPDCGSSFMKKSQTRMHYSVAEAL